MALKVRRVVVANNANGISAVVTDELVPAVSRFAGISGLDVWSTDQMPVDNSAAADAAQRAGVKHLIPNYVGTGGGTVLRINEIAPGNEKVGFTHRTETLDYCIQLSGECDCDLESGEVVHLKPGDVFINRGGLHTWVNRGSVPSVGAAVMIDAKYVEVGGKVLRTQYPSQQKAAKQ